MTDRKPGAPGQYAAVITAGELEKLRRGEQFTITLTRDDRPITEGTPYSKAAVLPDALAALICPDVEDPAPADALNGLLPRNGSQPMTGPLVMGGSKITDLGYPAAGTDAASKQYVDNRYPRHYAVTVSDKPASYQHVIDNWSKIGDYAPFVMRVQSSAGTPLFGVAYGFKQDSTTGCFIFMDYGTSASTGNLQFVNYAGSATVTEIK